MTEAKTFGDLGYKCILDGNCVMVFAKEGNDMIRKVVINKLSGKKMTICHSAAAPFERVNMTKEEYLACQMVLEGASSGTD